MNSIQPILSYSHTLALSVKERMSNLTERVYSFAVNLLNTIDAFSTRYQHATSEYIRSILSAITARFVLYSLNELSGNEYQEQAHVKLASITALGSTAQEVSFQTADNQTLSTVELVHPADNNPHRHTIVYFPTSYEIWQVALDFLKELHTAAGVDVYAINYRKTGTSSGFPENEQILFEDGTSYVQNLIAKGVPGSKLILFGGDIGASIATKVAAHLADSAIDVDLISLRSYSSLTEVIRQIFPLAPNFFASFAEAMNWGLDTRESLPKLKKNLVYMYSEKDPFVPTAVRLNTALATQINSLAVLKMDQSAFDEEFSDLAQDPYCTPHVRPLAAVEVGALVNEIRKLKSQ